MIDKPVLEATPIPYDEAQEMMLDDAITLLSEDIHAPQTDAWAIMFAAIEACLEAHKSTD